MWQNVMHTPIGIILRFRAANCDLTCKKSVWSVARKLNSTSWLISVGYLAVSVRGFHFWLVESDNYIISLRFSIYIIM